MLLIDPSASETLAVLVIGDRSTLAQTAEERKA